MIASTFRFRLVTVLLGMLTVLAFRGFSGSQASASMKNLGQTSQSSGVSTPKN